MIFLTGGTGFLGKELLGRLLIAYPEEEVCLLVRGTDYEHAHSRSKVLVKELFGPAHFDKFMPRVHTVCGDTTLENFGLGQSVFDSLAQQTTSIYHCAASVSLNQPLEEARAINVASTQQVTTLATASAARSNPIRFHHVSTAYVAGDTDRAVSPQDLNMGNKFRNGYEQSKAESELIVRALPASVSTHIYRPSIIVGDCFTGYTSAFNVLYVPAKFIVKGLFHALPAVPHAPFDVVPINYVADAITALSKLRRPSGEALHLSAGIGRESSPSEILEAIINALQAYKVKKPITHVPFLSQEVISLLCSSLTVAKTGVKSIEKLFTKRLDIIRQTLPFIPYMVKNPQFDTSSTERALQGILPLPPLFTGYADKIFGYCLETNWGKLPSHHDASDGAWFERLQGRYLSLAA